jgi:hypothetical protein
MGRPSISEKTTKPGPLARTGCTGRLGVDRMHAQGWLDIAKASPVGGQGVTMPPAKMRPHRPSPRPWPINPPVGIVHAAPLAAAAGQARPPHRHPWQQRHPQQQQPADGGDRPQQRRVQFDMEGDVGLPTGPHVGAAQPRVPAMMCGASTRTRVPQLSTSGRIGSTLGGGVSVTYVSSVSSGNNSKGGGCKVALGSQPRYGRHYQANVGIFGHSTSTAPDAAAELAQQQAHMAATRQWQGSASGAAGTSSSSAASSSSAPTPGAAPTAASADNVGVLAAPSPAVDSSGGVLGVGRSSVTVHIGSHGPGSSSRGGGVRV